MPKKRKYQEIKTKFGTYKVRYAYSIDDELKLVLWTDQLIDKFEGEYGDEIPYTKEGIEKYEVKFPKNFKV